MSLNIHRIVKQIIVRQQPAFTSVRLYGSRWTHRKPARVLLPFEANTKTQLKKENVINLDPGIAKKSLSEKRESIGNDDNQVHSPSSLTLEKTKELKIKKEEALKKRNFYLSQKKVFDDNSEIMYEKLKEGDSRISSLLVKIKSKKERLRSGHTLVEGWRLIMDGLEAKCKLKYIIFSRTEDLNNLRPFLPNTGVIIYKIPYKEIEMWSDVETSPGLLGVFDTPKQENIKNSYKPIPLQFICDNIRVAGNLGAILRTAVGVGCEKVLLSKGCVDAWDPKVIRSAAGAHFRLPIHHSIDWSEMSKLLEQDTSVFIADSNARIDIEDDTAESKNIGEPQMPVLPYYGIDYSTLKHITLIIGGETEGISEDSYALAAERNGLRLNIPLSKGVDSLNTGMATAVIAFEIRKQLIQAWTKIKLSKQIYNST